MAKRQPRVNMNSADPEELTQIEGIDDERARLIVQHRNKSGPFRSWEDVQQVPGIGEVLTEKAREMATFDQRQTKSTSSAASQSDSEVETEVESEVETDVGQEQGQSTSPAIDESTSEIETEVGSDFETDIEALAALAQLDLEAAAAYSICAEAMPIEDIRDTLISFREDHLRHVRDLGQLVEEMGGEAVDAEGPVRESSLTALASATSALGPDAGYLAMISNEQLTNSVYQAILQIEWDEDVQQVIKRNLEDEKRHLQWLQENRSRVMGAREGLAEQPPAAD
jgi:competence ComEA-like helix-hairpin-helix protein